jgi:hypothetical protein
VHAADRSETKAIEARRHSVAKIEGTWKREEIWEEALSGITSTSDPVVSSSQLFGYGTAQAITGSKPESTSTTPRESDKSKDGLTVEFQPIVT